MHPENLLIALALAIESQRNHERKALGFTGDSAIVGGWVEIKAALERGERIELSEGKS